MATKNKKIDWDEGIIDLMPEKKLEGFLKKFKKAILEDKETPEGRRRLAGAFGGKPADYKPVASTQNKEFYYGNKKENRNRLE